MGISNWFHPATKASPPDDLRSALFDALDDEDYEAAVHLINRNGDRIRAEFKSWMTVPVDIRADPVRPNRYGHALVTIARLFENSGDASLMRLLQGEASDNPIVRWQEAMERADKLIGDRHPDEAVQLLRDAIDGMTGFTGTAVDQFRPKLLGRLGNALAQLGDTAEAIRVTREALELCQRSGDEEGVQVYRRNLEFLGGHDIEAPGGQRMRVVFLDSDGRTLTRKELGGTGSVRWEMRQLEPIDPEAERLHTEGRAAGARGEHAAAIALFSEAAERDPRWAYPVYDRAFAHLCEQHFDAALDDYRKALELSPSGFFVARTAVDMLTREAAGEFPRGLYAAFAMLEHMPREQQESIAGQMVEKFPSHAPAWELRARLLTDPAAKLDAIEHGLAARPDPDVRGALLVQQAMALNTVGDSTRALEILDPLTSSVGDSLATYANATIFAAFIRGQKTN